MKQHSLFQTVGLQTQPGVEFSPCNKYRYKLWRIWDEKKPLVMCIGLNPSTGSDVKTDPTITHLTLALKQLNYGGFYMMNLYAFISSKPKELFTCVDAQGDNEKKLSEVEKLCSDVIVCWGKFSIASERIKEVLPRYPNAKCFGWNPDGSPMHPLFRFMWMKNKPKIIELFRYANH